MLPALVWLGCALVLGEAPLVAHRLPSRPIVDGDLAEWDGVPAVRIDRASQRNLFPGSRISRDWQGPADASLELRLGWTDDSLYLAGRVADDVLSPDERIWWQGDCIEVFLDVDREGDRGERRWNADDWQICLMPYQPGRPWGVSLHGREPVLSDAGLVGVEVAGRPAADAGYTFEARLPMAAFPGWARGRSIGFQVALNDHDRGPDGAEKHNYLTLDGSSRVYEDTRGMVELSFEGERPRERGSAFGRGVVRALLWVPLLLAVLAAALGAGRLFALLDRDAGRWRRRLLVGWALLAGTAVALPLGWERWRERKARSALEPAARVLARVAAELGERIGDGRSGLLGDGRGLLELLRGRRVEVRPRYAYRCLELAAAPRKEDAEGVPVRIEPREVGLARDLVLPLPRPAVLSTIHVFGRAVRRGVRLPPGASRRLDDALVVSVRAPDGAARRESFPLFDPALPDAERRDGPRVRPAWRDDEGVVDRYTIGPAELEEELVECVALRVADGRLGFRLLGVTYATADRPDVFWCLVPGEESEIGVPCAFWPDRGGSSARRLAPGESLEVGLPDDAEAVWIFLTADDPEVLELDRRGEPAAVVQVLAGGEAIARQPLMPGVHVWYSRADPERRPEGMVSRVAFHDPGSVLPTWEAVRVDLPEREGRSLRIEDLTLSHLFVGAVTAGSLLPAPGGKPDSLVLDRGDHLRVRPEVAQALRGTGLALVREGRVVAADLGPGGAPRSWIGSKWTPPEGKGAEAVDLGGRRFVARTFSLADGRQAVVALRPVIGASGLEAAARTAAWAFAAVGFPLLLFLVVDLLARIGRLQIRLASLFAGATLLPIALLFVLLYRMTSEDRARTMESRAEAALERARSRLFEIARDARALARRVAESSAIADVVAVPSPDPQEVVEALEGALGMAPRAALEPSLLLEVVRPDGSSERYYAPAGQRGASRFEVDRDGFEVHWGRLVVCGREEVRRGDLVIKVRAVGEAGPRLRAELSRAAGAEVGLFSLEGLPLTGEPVGHPSRRADLASALREGHRPAFDRAPDRLTSLDVVRSGSEPRFVLEVTLPRPGGVVEWFGRPVSLETFFLGFAAFVLGAAVLVASAAARRVVAPLEALGSAARAVAEGDLSAGRHVGRVRDRGEIGRVAQAFAEMTHRLARREWERSRVENALRRLSASLDLDETASVALELLAEIPPARAAALYLADDDRGLERRFKVLGDTAGLPEARAPGAEDEGQGARLLPPGEIGRQAGPVVELRLAPYGRRLGSVLLSYGGDVAAEQVERELSLMRHVAAQAAVALSHAQAYRRAVLDPELDVYVEHYLLRRLAEELDRASADGSETALVLFEPDLSRTRRSRDARAALRSLAKAVRGAVREAWTVGRVGARLALLAPGAGRAAAEEAARRVVRRFGDRTAESVPASLRYGVAVYPEDAKSAGPLLEAATRALRAGAEPEVGKTRELETDTRPYVFRAPASLKLLRDLVRVAPSEASVLILGETGAGKDVAAELLHRFSRRRDGPFVALNASAIPVTLLEAELFGHEKGAFTGADRARPGRIEHADGGTLFLDEIGDLPLGAQAKLLRALQERRVTRLGSRHERPVDVRIVAATNRDLEEEVRAGRFRADLLYRLKVVTLRVPPLRDRAEEIPDLVEAITARVSRRGEAPAKAFSPGALDRLHRHRWPGNVRELENVVRRALLLAEGDVVTPEDIEFDEGVVAAGSARRREEAGRAAPGGRRTLEERRRRLFERVVPGTEFRSRDYCRWVGVAPRTALRDLQALMEAGLVERIGKRRGASYRVLRRP